MPNYISPEAKNFIKKLLHWDPKMRPGVRNKDELKNDPFFRDIDWKKLMKWTIPPPIHLKIEDESDNEEEAFLHS
jgi:serum/glucocorticoid-regulated kinase 2